MNVRTEARAHYPRASERWRFYLDFASTFPLCGQSVADYFKYEFARRPLAERRRFVTALRVNRVLRAFNDPKAVHVFRDKAEFHRVFGDLMGRAIFDPAGQPVNDLGPFLESHARVVVKPVAGSYGRGIRFLEAGEHGSPAELHARLRGHHSILEEAICQHASLAELHPASVNTIRVITVLRGDAVHVTTVFLRAGSHGRCVDNFFGGGIAAPLDVDTGCITAAAIDKKLTRHANHPTTGVPLVGFLVPSWTGVLALARTAATRVPAVRYVGWDVAITRDGRPILVEGNDSANFDAQAVDQVGRWPLYRALMK